jgi:hypothetical protein
MFRSVGPSPSVDIINTVAANLKRQEEPGACETRRHASGLWSWPRPASAQLKRVQAEDSDFERRIWIVAGGKRGEPISRYLNGDMLTAWRLFVAVSAWGEYDSRSYARVLRTAGRPYNVRHAIGQDLCEQGEDLKLVAVGLGLAHARGTRAAHGGKGRRQIPTGAVSADSPETVVNTIPHNNAGG